MLLLPRCGRQLLWAVLLLLMAPAYTSPAQPPTTSQPQGRFLQPSARIGEIVEYELRYRHAPGLNVIFPDSTAEYAPFEFVGKTYQPTRTRQGISLDQTTYRLRTFDLAPVQSLQLPVTILQGRDTLTLQIGRAHV